MKLGLRTEKKVQNLFGNVSLLQKVPNLRRIKDLEQN